jgi:hypothetical protein
VVLICRGLGALLRLLLTEPVGHQTRAPVSSSMTYRYSQVGRRGPPRRCIGLAQTDLAGEQGNALLGQALTDIAGRGGTRSGLGESSTRASTWCSGSSSSTRASTLRSSLVSINDGDTGVTSWSDTISACRRIGSSVRCPFRRPDQLGSHQYREHIQCVVDRVAAQRPGRGQQRRRPAHRRRPPHSERVAGQPSSRERLPSGRDCASGQIVESDNEFVQPSAPPIVSRHAAVMYSRSIVTTGIMSHMSRYGAPRGKPQRGNYASYVVGSGQIYRASVSLPPAEADKLVATAREMDCSVSGLIQQIIAHLDIDERGLPSWYEAPGQQAMIA